MECQQSVPTARTRAGALSSGPRTAWGRIADPVAPRGRRECRALEGPGPRSESNSAPMTATVSTRCVRKIRAGEGRAYRLRVCEIERATHTERCTTAPPIQRPHHRATAILEEEPHANHSTMPVMVGRVIAVAQSVIALCSLAAV